MKRIWLAVLVLAAVPTGIFAGNTSIVDQNGDGNSQTTFQSGRNFAVTTQRGSGNHAETVQNGINSISVIHQNGTDLSRSTVQSGDFQLSSSTQVTSRSGAGSLHQITGGNIIRSEIIIEITPED
ncbi:MAG: hypothetical protein P8X51_16805 [Maritimibacter sp.]|jgi:hypothetical protein